MKPHGSQISLFGLAKLLPEIVVLLLVTLTTYSAAFDNISVNFSVLSRNLNGKNFAVNRTRFIKKKVNPDLCRALVELCSKNQCTSGWIYDRHGFAASNTGYMDRIYQTTLG